MPLGVIARENMPFQSYWLLASPMPASSCGCVATTWNASMNASCTTFQFAGKTLATWTAL